MTGARALRRIGRVVSAAFVAACLASAASQDAPPHPENRLLVDVTTRDAKPVAGADVALLADPPDVGACRLVEAGFLPAVQPERVVAAARTDESGRATFAAIATSPYRVRVRAAGLAVSVAHVPVAPGTPAAPVRVALDPACPLSGRVTSKSGVAAAGVVVFAAPHVRSSDLIEPALQFRATTGTDGSYALDGLPRGTYEMWTWRDAYGFEPVGTARVPDVATFDATVTDGGTVRGHVRSAGTGEPLAGAVVELWEGSWRSGSVRFGPATTDAAGTFEMRTGRAHVRIDAATLSCPGRADAVVVDLHADVDDGAVKELNFELVAEAVLAGGVVGPGGPVAGAKVSVDVARDAWSGMWNDQPTPRRAVAAADGTFRVGGLGEGRALVGVNDVPSRSVVVDLRAGETSTCELTIGAKTEPELVTRRFSGRVVRVGGAPVAGASVWVSSRRGQVGYGDTTSTVAGADGSFSVVVTGLADQFGVGAKARGCAEATRWFESRLDVDPPPIELTLPSLPSVRGTVRSSLGARVAGARVLVGEKMILKFGRHFVDWERTAGATVGDDGTYEAAIETYHGGSSSWSGSYCDEYVVAVELPGHAPAVSAPFAAPSASRPHVVDFELGAGSELRGRLVAAETGAVAAGATVSASPKPAADPWPPKFAPGLDDVRTLTGADGTFVLSGLSPGRYLVTAAAKDLEPERRETDVPAAAPLEIALVGPRDLVGRVVGPDGAPVAGAWLSARPGSRPAGARDLLAFSETDATGAFRFERLPDGEYRVSVLAPDAEPDLAPVEDVPLRTGAKAATIRLARGTAVAGVLVDAAGKPVADAVAHLRRGSVGAYPDSATTDAAGAFVFHGCGPGAASVEFHDVGVRFEGVAPGATKRLQLPGALSIRGTLRAPDGGDCYGGAFEARRIDVDAAAPRVVHLGGEAGRGKFVFRHLAPGRYEVASSAPSEVPRGGERTRCRLPSGTIVDAGASAGEIVGVPWESAPSAGTQRR